MKLPNLKQHLIIGGVLAVIWSFFLVLNAFNADLVFYDFFQGFLQGDGKEPKSLDDIVIVAIDQPSFDELGRQWPWPRSLHARLIETLTREGAAVIALDILFAEPSVEKEDKALVDSIAKAGNVVLVSAEEPTQGMGFSGRILTYPFDALLDKAAIGLATVPMDPDNVVRRYYNVPSEESGFAVTTARQFSGSNVVPPENAFIPYLGPPNTFRTISYYQALDPSEYLPAGFFKGKIVLIGLSVKTSAETGRVDTFATPYQRSGMADYMSGVEIHANMIVGIMNRNWITRPPRYAALLLIILMAVLGSLLQVRWRPLRSAALTAGACLAFFISALICLRMASIFLPVTLPLLALGLPYPFFGGQAYIMGEKRRREIRNAFSKYLSPAILKVILDHPDDLELGGKKCLVTVFFSDLAGFTTISEKLAPEKVSEFLNRYFDAMTEIVFKHNGTVDKFIGDSIMAFWGAPVPDPDHAVNACLAALEMQTRLEYLRKDMQAEGMPSLSMRIGINTGESIVGNMGSSKLFNYTLLGDTVNLASRLEGANKEFGTSILISRAVVDHAAGRILSKRLGEIRVKGKTEATEVYKLTGIQPMGPSDPDPPNQVAG